jgi:hypothetical protein
MSTFEDRLWLELVAEHEHHQQAPDSPVRLTRPLSARTRPLSARPRSRRRHHGRRPALLTGTALATAVAATTAALTLGASTSTPPAYAVTTNSDGTVTVTLTDISAITALNAELTRDGINAQAIPMTATCPAHAPLVTMPTGTDPRTYTMTIVPSQIPAGYTAVLAAGQTASGQVELLQGAVQPPVPACVNSAPTQLHYVNPAHASPAMKAALARARRAAQAAAKH